MVYYFRIDLGDGFGTKFGPKRFVAPKLVRTSHPNSANSTDLPRPTNDPTMASKSEEEHAVDMRSIVKAAVLSSIHSATENGSGWLVSRIIDFSTCYNGYQICFWDCSRIEYQHFRFFYFVFVCFVQVAVLDKKATRVISSVVSMFDIMEQRITLVTIVFCCFILWISCAVLVDVIALCYNALSIWTIFVGTNVVL